ncbi:MAG TPA: alpha/beta fold hydrolase [Blastocatellia bacterium]|nr:alpha/beta fold hydrolase [Blastocatellia bacterium]
MTSHPHEYQERVVPFTAGDGFQLNLINVRGQEPGSKGPVVLVHGAGVRANLFRAPARTTIVDYLIQNGYDVWLLNWRASIEFEPNTWTLDKAALYDHPEAIKTVAKETGSDEIKAIIHCQGSTSFMMSAMAGLVPQVKTIVTNAVSLHPVVPPWSVFKLNFMVPIFSSMTEYLNPRWGIEKSSNLAAKGVSLMTKLFHHECENAVCKQVSITYGAGFPALWRHENITEETHEWLKHEFAEVPIAFFRQIAKCVRRGNLVSVEGHKQLPADFVAQPPQTDARFAFFAGEKNQCFLAKSQVESYEYFNKLRKNYHALHVLPQYSHLDVFWGKKAVEETYPLILKELDTPVN